MAASEGLFTNGATPATPASGKTKWFFNASKQLCIVDDAGLVTILAGQPAVAQSTPADPAGTSNTSGLMMGLAGSLTLVYSTRMNVQISGNLTSNGTTIGNGGKVRLRYGTGSAPANAGALTGTVIGNQVTSVLESTTASTKQAFTCQAIVTGLTLATAYWLDVDLAAIVAGTASISNLSLTAFEL